MDERKKSGTHPDQQDSPSLTPSDAPSLIPSDKADVVEEGGHREASFVKGEWEVKVSKLPSIT